MGERGGAGITGTSGREPQITTWTARPVPSRRRRRARRAAVVAVVVVTVATGGLAVDLTRYAHAAEGRLLPGTTVAGVDVGGMTLADAHARASAVVQPRLDRTVSVRHDGRTWTRSLTDLGVTSDLDEQLAAAAAASRIGWLDRARVRWLDHSPGPDLTVTLSDPGPGIDRWARDLAIDLDTEPVDASVAYDDRSLRVAPHRAGLQVDPVATIAAIDDALQTAGATPTVTLPVRHLTPQVTLDDLDQILFLDQSAHRLDLFLDGRRARSYTVATGTGRYPTPTGEFEVTLKRYLPTWVNPAPDGWGRGLPRRIGPGRNNPLGLRALNWSVGAIRFHGTADVDSLGRDASHGCVRLSNADIVELYDLIDEGAMIVSVR